VDCEACRDVNWILQFTIPVKVITLIDWHVRLMS